jgi:hypothetical protein
MVLIQHIDKPQMYKKNEEKIFEPVNSNSLYIRYNDVPKTLISM